MYSTSPAWLMNINIVNLTRSVVTSAFQQINLTSVTLLIDIHEPQQRDLCYTLLAGRWQQH